MKKLFTIFLISIFFSLPLLMSNGMVYAKTINYARVTNSNVPIYSNPIISNEYVLFYIEPSYFIELLEPESKGFYHVKYMDIEGYIKSENLTFVSGTPLMPYPTNTNFRVFAPSGLHLRSTPQESQGPYNIITTIPYLENNLIYYGKVYGEEAISNKGDLWYYCKYITNEEQYCGFVYSVFCDMLKDIPPNTEQLDITDAPFFDEPNKETSNTTDKLSTLSKPAQIVIIALVCLPCLLIVYLLFKPTKITAVESRKKKKKIKKLRKSDYYEFDDYN